MPKNNCLSVSPFCSILCILFIIICAFPGCSKEKKKIDDPVIDIDPPIVMEKKDSGVYVLSRGHADNGMPKLGYYDLAKGQYTENNFIDEDVTSKLKGVCYGGFQYGEKIYVFFSSNESKILVLNKKDAKFLAEMDCGTPFGTNVWPKKAAADKNLIYVVGSGSFVHVYDTLTLKRVKSFGIPEWANDVAIQNDRLFVSNQKPMSSIGVDASLLIMNMNTGIIEKNMNVGWYPQSMVKDNEGFVYLHRNGNEYYDGGAALLKIDASSGKIVKQTSSLLRGLAIYKNNILAIAGHPVAASTSGKIPVYDRLTLELVKENFITDGTQLIQPRSIYVDEKSGSVYIIDTKDSKSPGHIYVFGKEGKKLLDFPTTNSINPHTLLFKN